MVSRVTGHRRGKTGRVVRDNDEGKREMAAEVERGEFLARERGNRPRSASIPEGVARERARGPDGFLVTCSCGWRSGGGRGGSNNKERRGAVVGSVEDTDALIALARRRVGRGAEPQKSGSEGSGGAKGGTCVSLPYMLSKYASMYNKNGSVGIYTRQEREAIITRLKRKRSRMA